MPYSLESKNLPSYVVKLPDSVKAKWIAVFNRVYESEGEEMAFIVANNWLKRRIKKSSVEGKTDKTYVMERITFELNGEQLVKCTDDGQEYVDFVLTDLGADNKGVQYPKELLEKWTEQVNSGFDFVGDIDHAEYDEILSRAESVEDAANLIKNTKKGIAKTIKALFKNGKMWVRAMIDKRYKKMIEKAKGVSLEAIVSRDADGRVYDGDLLGFTFAVNQRPVNPRAVIA